jgi:two-component system, OmpR family, response regulator
LAEDSGDPVEARILIADDESNIRDVISFALQKAGYECRLAADGQEAIELFRKEHFDLVILDVRMPRLDGLETCKELRKGSGVPIIFLSSLDDEIDRVVGLEIGADDYMSKPFSPRELIARIRARLRRSDFSGGSSGPVDSTDTPSLSIGALRISPEEFEVAYGNAEIELTAMEFSLLLVFVRSPSRVFRRDELMDRAYGEGTFVSDRTIDSHIRRIRSRFSAHQVDIIDTVHGVGYRLARELRSKA